jgi:hypothetical protein
LCLPPSLDTLAYSPSPFDLRENTCPAPAACRQNGFMHLPVAPSQARPDTAPPSWQHKSAQILHKHCSLRHRNCCRSRERSHIFLLAQVNKCACALTQCSPIPQSAEFLRCIAQSPPMVEARCRSSVCQLSPRFLLTRHFISAQYSFNFTRF